jgi:YVTN family beta-propeller protein
MLRAGELVAGVVLWLCALQVQAATFAYITNQGSHDVSVVALDSLRVVATLPVGRSPAGVVASTTGQVYVSNPDSRTVSVIDMAGQRVVETWPAGSGPVGLDVSPDGRTLCVADWYANELLLIDTRHPQTTAVAIAVGHAPAGVAVHNEGALAFVAERDDNSVAVVSLPLRRVIGRIAVGRHPFALLLDAPRQRLYALNVQSDDVSVIDIAGLAVIATIPVGKAPYGAALALQGRLLYVSNQHDDSVSVIDAEQLRLQHTLQGFGYPEGVAAEGERVYVVNWMDDSLSVLDAASGRALAQIATGKNPRGFGAFVGAVAP